jgi:hypothetical protein
MYQTISEPPKGKYHEESTLKYKLNTLRKIRENNIGLKIHKLYDGPKNSFTHGCDKHFKISYLFAQRDLNIQKVADEAHHRVHKEFSQLKDEKEKQKQEFLRQITDYNSHLRAEKQAKREV